MDRDADGSLRIAWRAFWTSRLAVWGAGLLGLLWLGRAPGSGDFDPGGLTRPFGPFGDLLVAPAARWDAVWYLSIAQEGYADSADHAKAAFYPLYPLLAKVVGWPLGSELLGGLVVSLAAFLGALVLLHRLAELELGARDARSAVLLVAWFPAAFFFSAVYAESLFLLLSVGAVLAARQGRWGWAGAAGMLAAATRNSGVVLLVPLLLLYLWGPRADRDAEASAEPLPWWRPRHRPEASILWLALVPLGLAAWMAYVGIELGDPLAPFAAQELWGRQLAPLGGIWEGARAAWLGLRQLVEGDATPVYFREAGGDPFPTAGQNIMLLGFLAFGLVALAGALRRLPLAYGAYAGVALALTLSYPVGAQPLMSLPRFLAVLFPLHFWLARWLGERGDRGIERGLAFGAVLLGLMAAQFARWGFVA